MPDLTEMLNQAKAAALHAYVPYSHFPVGVCIRSENNQLFAGCNVENAAYPIGQCAETSAIGAMITHGQTKIREVVIVSPRAQFITPCGACRQRLYEFALPETQIHLYNNVGDFQTIELSQLLPKPFSFKN